MTPFGAVTVLGCLCLIVYTSSTDITDGNTSPRLTSFIYSGQEVSEHVPYMISLQFQRTNRNWHHICGGSIISTNYVLTAAHCLVPQFNETGIKRHRIMVGRTSLKSLIGSRHRIVSYTAHPKYLKQFSGYDIGVIKVHPEFKFNQRTVAKIQIDTSKTLFINTPLVFHGWGRSESVINEKLRRANFTTIANEYCRLRGMRNLTSTDFCVISKNSSYAYLGDSGGPLVNEDQTVQIGVCSYGFFNPMKKFRLPTVFTRVSEFSTWIKDEIAK